MTIEEIREIAQKLVDDEEYGRLCTMRDVNPESFDKAMLVVPQYLALTQECER